MLANDKQRLRARRTALVTALVLGATTVTASTAGAEIVINKGIAGVELGMSEDQVTSLLGQPYGKSYSGEPDVDPGVQTDFLYGNGLVVSFVQNMTGVIAVATTDSVEKTTNGAGVGTKVAALKRKVKRLRCDRKRKPRECSVGRQVVGKKRTVFEIKRGFVTRVAVLIQFP